MTQDPRYTAAAVSAALATDERTAELGVRVSVRGDTLLLTGTVAGQARREEVTRVAREAAPDLTVVDDLRVTDCTAPTGHEELR